MSHNRVSECPACRGKGWVIRLDGGRGSIPAYWFARGPMGERPAVCVACDALEHEEEGGRRMTVCEFERFLDRNEVARAAFGAAQVEAEGSAREIMHGLIGAACALALFLDIDEELLLAGLSAKLDELRSGGGGAIN